MDKKKIIIAVVVVVLIIGIGISYYLTAQQTTASPTQGPNSTSVSDTGTTPNQNGMYPQTRALTPTGAANTPEAIAQIFYSWYINYPKDVVATGAYKTSPYLTKNFIDTINGFAVNYNPQYDPIFCNVNRTKDFQVSHVMAASDPTKIKVQIMNTGSNPQPLYDVIFVQQNGVLKIDDIQCD